MIRILNAEPDDYFPEARKVLLQLGELTETKLSRADLLDRISTYDVLIVRLAHQVDRKLLDEGKNLKAVVSATTGLDHIDLDYAANKGVAVLSLRGEVNFLRTVSATAEHTWALLLALLRRVPSAFDAVRQGQWDRDAFRGHELDGKHLGIWGLGRVGEKVSRFGLAFGMQVLAYDPYVQSSPYVVEYCNDLTDFLHRSDVLSLHLPLNTETTCLLNTQKLSHLPRGAILVNTSRGEIVDEEALVDALDTGHLAGAAIDVVTHERCTQKRLNSPLLSYARTHNNLLITPHIGGATFESMAKTELFMARKLSAFLRSQGI